MRLKRNYKFVRYRDAGRAQPQTDATPATPEPALQTRLSLTGTFQAVWHPTSHPVPAVNGLGLQDADEDDVLADVLLQCTRDADGLDP